MEINAYWEKAIQGIIILAAIVSEAAGVQTEVGGSRKHAIGNASRV